MPEVERRSLIIFPNPASGKIRVRSSSQLRGFTWEVTDKTGRNVTQPQPWNAEDLDISQLASGLYILRLKKEKEIYSQKLVVQRMQINN